MEKSNQVIDYALGAQLVGGDQKLAEEMLSMLIECLPEHQHEIQQAYLANNYNQLASATHKLHGATCYCGTPRLKMAAKNLEVAIKAGKTKNLTDLYGHLCTEIAAVLAA